MDSNKFKEALDNIKKSEEMYANRIPELGKIAVEKYTSLLEKERECYMQLSEIFKIEGSTNYELRFADGGRYVKILETFEEGPNGETESRNGFHIEYEDIHAKDGRIAHVAEIRNAKDNPTLMNDLFGGVIDTEGKLNDAYNLLIGEGQAIDLTNQVIETYISYRNGIKHKRSKMIDVLVPHEDEGESYW